MGTSKSLGTPAGGAWTGVKQSITSVLGGSTSVTPAGIVGATIGAAGGLAVPSIPSASGGGGGGGSGGGGGVAAAGRASVARATSGLAGFGVATRDGGIGAGLQRLGLEELRGRPAAEVVARIAEHLAGETTGLARDVLTMALQDAIFEAARLEGDSSYEALEQSLDSFLSRDGVEGLIALFLSRYVFDRVWVLIESHVDQRSTTNSSRDGLMAGVEAACEANVRALIADYGADGQFGSVDWFGSGGLRLADGLIKDLETRLRAQA